MVHIPRRFAHPTLSVAKQLHYLKSSPLCPGSGGLNHGELNWTFEARPTPLSRIYQIEIQYRLGSPVQVFVRDPNLKQLADGKKIPHLYLQDPAKLCLFKPGQGEWDNAMKLTETIVVWANVWLFYFEQWLGTGQWLGGGEHPEVEYGKRKKNSRHRRRRS